MGYITSSIRRTLIDLRRQVGTTLITISTVAVVFWLLGLLVLLAVNFQRLAAEIERGFRLSVFLSTSCIKDCQDFLQAQVGALEEVEQVELIEKNQAWARYRKKSGLELENLLEENPFPDVMEVKPKKTDSENLQSLAQKLSALEGVDEVVYGQSWLVKFLRLKSILYWLIIALAGAVFLASAVIVSNTIRLLVTSRREEIEILELIGASRLFVGAPFYLQGLLMGLAGAAIGLGLCWFTFFLSGRWIGELIELRLEFMGTTMIELMIGCGGVMGLAGTVFSLKSYLRI